MPPPTPKPAELDRWGFPARFARVEVNPPPRVPKIGPGSAKDQRLLAGLQTLCRSRNEGQTFSLREIAKACDVDHEHVRKIARAGLRKLRNRLPPEVRDDFEAMLSQARTAAVPKNTKNKNAED